MTPRNARLSAELRDLRERFRVPLDKLTADEIATFVDCCRKIDNPYSAANEELLDPSVRVGSLRLHRLTIGAAVWLERYADRWWKRNDRRYYWALVFAMANATDPRAFEKARTEFAATREIVLLALRCTFSRAALDRAVNFCLGVSDVPPDPKDEAGAVMDWGAVVARLETQSGIRREDWLWGRSASYAMKAYSDLRRFAREAGPVRAGHVKDELDKAINELARLKKSIKMRLEKEAAESGEAKS